MEQIVPGSLQRLSAADIVRMAGLSAASLGQEYCRGGAVRRTQRQGMRLEGVVELSPPATAASDGEADVRTEALSYTVAVEIQSPTVWSSTCSCHAEGSALCAHAAALLYRWLAQPISFLVPPSSSTPVTPVQHEHIIRAEDGAQNRRTPTIKPEPPTLAAHTPGDTDAILRQLGLSELRGIAREYDIATNGMNKHLLADAILASMQQTEAVRRVAATLEKPQRQLLAAITLAGGSVTDEDLRGLFERFALGHANQLQGTLLILQNKALLLRTNLNSSNQQRIGLGGALVDIGWYVPREVRAALRVTVPITPFAIEQAAQDEVHLTTTFDLLADLLLVARALNGHHLEQTQEPPARNHETFSLARMSGGLARDGSIAVPPPEDLPSTALFSSLQKAVARPPAFLRFLVRLLRLADILYRDDTGLPYFRVLPNAAELLLGPGRMEAARDLFQLWTTSSSYEELYDLSEEGLRLRCRATALHHPILRPGELDAENREARQSLLALLSQVPAGQWVSFPSFARFVYRLNPLFLQKRQHLFSTPHWWLERTEGRPLRPLQQNDWQHAELRYLARLLSGPLHWWGFCDIVRAEDGRMLAFRLTSTAGLLPGKEFPVQAGTKTGDDHDLAGVLTVVDGETVLIDCTIAAWPAIALLEHFAEVAGVDSGRLRYRLSSAALGKAMSRGQDPTSLLQFLHSVQLQRPAEPLARMLEQLERRIASYGRVRIYTGASLLETADEMVMSELSATTRMDGQVARKLSPTLLILQRPGSEQLFDELKRRGQAPLLHEEDVYGAE